MKQVRNVWLPDEEQEVIKFLEAKQNEDGIGLYQHGKLKKALRYVQSFRVAVDVGAHCGLWSMWLAKKFQEVNAFEPIQAHRDCLILNAPTVNIYGFALGDKPGNVRMMKGVKSTGDTHISPEGEYEAEVRTLDSFHLKDVDFIKIDCEGYELFVLRGAEELINTYKPVVIVEQKPGKGRSYGIGDTEAVKWLMTKGYKVQEVISGDFILTPI